MINLNQPVCVNDLKQGLVLDVACGENFTLVLFTDLKELDLSYFKTFYSYKEKVFISIKKKLAKIKKNSNQMYFNFISF